MDIEEGLNAGMWTIGLAVTGNLMGLTESEILALNPEELDNKRKIIFDQLYKAGAHFVVDSLADCPMVVEEINERLANGERP